MAELRSLCVYCGSSPGARPDYVEASRTLADALHQRGISLVYGGAHVGIMGAVADRLLQLGGEVTGVIPKALVEWEVAHTGLTNMFIVEDMHERKATMARLSDGFIALPGGLGTLEELFEVLTWSQLGIHAKPCGLLNVVGFYDGLLEFLDLATSEVFMKPAHRQLLIDDQDAGLLLDKLAAFKPSPVMKVPAGT